MGDKGERCQNNHGKAAGQSVVAIDDVHRVGNTPDGKGGEDHRHRQPGERVIDTGQIEPIEHSAQEPGGCRARQHGEEQPLEHPYPLGEVFGEPTHEGRCRSQ